tara:strand:+ start:220 stop:402 length:183 start_codon:yes stop_codon:yes gene_type:complete
MVKRKTKAKRKSDEEIYRLAELNPKYIPAAKKRLRISQQKEAKKSKGFKKIWFTKVLRVK